MNFEVKKIEDMTPEFLFGLLHRKHLLSLPVRNNPVLLANLAINGDFYAVMDNGQTVAWLIEARSLEPATLEVALVPEDKTLCLHTEKLSKLAWVLRDRWFSQEGWGKVQAQVAKSRSNACRTLKALGFVCETRSIGIRKGITLSKDAEPLMIYGLLPDDPIPVLESPAVEESHAEA